METNSYLKNPAGTRERYFSRRFSFGKISMQHIILADYQ